MKSLILTITIFFSLSSCCTDREYIVVATPYKDIFTKQLQQTFEDGTPIEIDEIVSYGGKKMYLLREGKNDNGCIASRTEIELGESGYYFMRIDGKTEICKGKDCNDCSFIKNDTLLLK